MTVDRPEFICDSMLGGLARWLRAAGYDAAFAYGADDADVLRLAMRAGAMLLSSDGPLFDRNLIRDKTVRALFVPGDLTKLEQLAFVLGDLGLPVRPMPRCMACGGRLVDVAKESVRDEAPPKTFARVERFWRCLRCGKLFWHGSHWTPITLRLEQVRGKG